MELSGQLYTLVASPAWKEPQVSIERLSGPPSQCEHLKEVQNLLPFPE
jgi:hypothetical protein